VPRKSAAADELDPASPELSADPYSCFDRLRTERKLTRAMADRARTGPVGLKTDRFINERFKNLCDTMFSTGG
jgi:hypothetical protein